ALRDLQTCATGRVVEDGVTLAHSGWPVTSGIVCVSGGTHGRNAMRLIVLAAVLLTACSTAPSREAATVREADARAVEGCELLGTVEQAAEMGATHIVWLSTGAGYAGTVSSGSAYRCD